MATKKPVIHADDHRPSWHADGAGADPFDWLAAPAGGAVAYPVVHSLEGWELKTYLDFANNEAFGSFAADTAAPFGGYITSVAGNTDGIGIYVGLGPLGLGTAWAVDLFLRQGNDSGKVCVEYGTTPVDELATTAALGYAGGAGIGSSTSFSDPDELDTSFSGWWKPASGTIDLYSAAGTTWGAYTATYPFWVAGADGSMLTADAVDPGPYGGASRAAFETGGGDVCWWIRVRSNGKNASSSGYGFRMAGFRMYRINGNGGPVS